MANEIYQSFSTPLVFLESKNLPAISYNNYFYYYVSSLTHALGGGLSHDEETALGYLLLE